MIFSLSDPSPASALNAKPCSLPTSQSNPWPMGKPPPGMIYKTTDSLEKNANEGCPMCLLCVEVLDPSYQKIPREIESDINATGQPVAAQYSRLSRGGIKTSSIQHEH